MKKGLFIALVFYGNIQPCTQAQNKDFGRIQLSALPLSSLPSQKYIIIDIQEKLAKDPSIAVKDLLYIQDYFESALRYKNTLLKLKKITDGNPEYKHVMNYFLFEALDNCLVFRSAATLSERVEEDRDQKCRQQKCTEDIMFIYQKIFTKYHKILNLQFSEAYFRESKLAIEAKLSLTSKLKLFSLLRKHKILKIKNLFELL